MELPTAKSKTWFNQKSKEKVYTFDADAVANNDGGDNGDNTPVNVQEETVWKRAGEFNPDELAIIDQNNDGKIDDYEIKQVVQKSIFQTKEVKIYRYGILILILVWLGSLGAIFGVVYGAIEMSKESKVKSSNEPVLVTNDGSSVIQTANSDFFVSPDGSLLMRNVINNTKDDHNAGKGTLKVASTALTVNVPLSSDLSDSTFNELKVISITSSLGATMFLNILGMVRMPPHSPNRLGSVTLLTHVGRIVIDGTSVSYFDEMQAALFETAGFKLPAQTSAGGKRRLEGISSLMGTFNAVPSVTKTVDSIQTPTTSFTVSNAKLPEKFTMDALKLTPCVQFRSSSSNSLGSIRNGGSIPIEENLNYCDLLGIGDDNIVEIHSEVTGMTEKFIGMKYRLYKMGSDLYRTEYIHPAFPEQTLVEIHDGRSNVAKYFHYQVDSISHGYKYNASMKSFNLIGPVHYFKDSTSPPADLFQDLIFSSMDYLGEIKLNKEAVRVWGFHLMSDNIHGFWYDTVKDQELRRVDFGLFGMLEVKSITMIETDVNLDFLFVYPTYSDVPDAPSNSEEVTISPKHISKDPFGIFKQQYNQEQRWNEISKPLYSNRTSTPSMIPSARPSRSPKPSFSPTFAPTMVPTTESPTEAPSTTPSEFPSAIPTESPTEPPTNSPTEAPSMTPTEFVSTIPTELPVEYPTESPTEFLSSRRLQSKSYLRTEVKQSKEDQSQAIRRDLTIEEREYVESKLKWMEATSLTYPNLYSEYLNSFNDPIELHQARQCTIRCNISDMYDPSSKGNALLVNIPTIHGLSFVPYGASKTSDPCYLYAYGEYPNISSESSAVKRKLLGLVKKIKQHATIVNSIEQVYSILDFDLQGELELTFCNYMKGIEKVEGSPKFSLILNDIIDSSLKNFADILNIQNEDVRVVHSFDLPTLPMFFTTVNNEIIFNDVELGNRLFANLANSNSDPKRINDIGKCLKNLEERDELSFTSQSDYIKGDIVAGRFSKTVSSVVKESHFTTDFSYGWHPYFCGLMDETKHLTSSLTIPLPLLPFTITYLDYSEETVREYQQFSPYLSQAISLQSSLDLFSASIENIEPIIILKSSYFQSVWNSIKQLSGLQFSDSAQLFDQFSSTHEDLIDIFIPRNITSEGSAVSRLFLGGDNKLYQVMNTAIYNCTGNNCLQSKIKNEEEYSRIFGKMDVFGWGCQHIRSIAVTKYELGPLLLTVCDSKEGSCQQFPQSFGSFKLDSVTYTCYVAFDGNYSRSNSDAFLDAWRFYFDQDGISADVLNPAHSIIQSIVNIRPKTSSGNEYIRAFTFCSSTLNSRALVDFSSSVLTLARTSHSWDSLSSNINAIAEFNGVILYSKGSCFSTDYINYVKIPNIPEGISSSIDKWGSYFVGTAGCQWTQDINPALEMESSKLILMMFRACGTKQCDGSKPQLIGKFRDANNYDVMRHCYIAFDGSYSDLDSRKYMHESLNAMLHARNKGYWWDHNGWNTNMFVSIRGNLKNNEWMNVFTFCAAGSGDFAGFSDEVLAQVRLDEGEDGFASTQAKVSSIANKYGLNYVNHETCAVSEDDMRMNKPFILQNSGNYVGSHGCQWVDTASPLAERPWNLADAMTQSCSYENGCNRYLAHFMTSYVQNTTSWMCYAAVDGNFSSIESFSAIKNDIRVYNNEDFSGYWFGGNSYNDPALEGFYTNSLWMVRSPVTADFRDWFNGVFWCSVQGSSNAFGGEILDLMRQTSNMTEIDLAFGAAANKYGVQLNFDGICASSSDEQILSKPLTLQFLDCYVGAEGSTYVGSLNPKLNSGWNMAQFAFTLCDSTGCNHSYPQLLTNFSISSDEKAVCYMAIGGAFQEEGLASLNSFAEGYRRYTSSGKTGLNSTIDSFTGETTYMINQFTILRSKNSGRDYMIVYVFCISDQSTGNVQAYTARVFDSLKLNHMDIRKTKNSLYDIANKNKIRLLNYF